MSGPDYFADPLGGLTDPEWDELAGDRFYSSAFWLRLCGFEGGGVAGGVHLDLAGGGRAAVPVIAVGDNPHPNCQWGRLLAARGLPSPPERGILVGQRRGYLAHLLASPAADRASAAAGLLAAVRAVRPPLGADAPARVALYLTTPDVLALRAAGVRSLPVALAADAWIAIPPGGWDAWLQSLGSRHRLRRIRSEVRRFAQAGYRVWRCSLRESYRDVARLAVQTEHRYGKAADLAGYTEAFRQQGEFAGDRAEVLLCGVDDGPPVGCCLYYRDDDTIYLRAVGFDYDRLRGAAEYFNLTYYLPAQLPGVRWLHAGMSTPDGKALRGAELRPLWLLDLTEDSVLERHPEQVLAHNAAYRTDLAASSPAVAGALRTELWDADF
ncbi:MAG: GNAT family N-acetyltransferase [Jatrophihabitans sp.]